MDNTQLATILNAINGLNEQVQAALKQIRSMSDAYSSDDIKDLAAALAKAQGEYKPIGYNRENPYFKSSYADLDTIMRSVKIPLAKNGLAFIQQIRITEDGATVLHSILMHSTGQWIESRNRIIPVKNDQQTFGSTLTYQKRYAAISLLGVTVAHDASDDDGEVAMVESRQIYAKGPALNNKYDPRDQAMETITKEQIEELELELDGYDHIAELVLEGLKIQSIADMPKSKYHVSLKRIREIKQNEGNR